MLRYATQITEDLNSSESAFSERPAFPLGDETLANKILSGSTITSKTDQLFDAIGSAIVAGQFDTELFTSELVIEKHYKVSRTVAREAVRMLRAKGLLTSSSSKGLSVVSKENWNLMDRDVLRWTATRTYSGELLEELTQLRLTIEPGAAGLAAKRVTDRNILALRQQHKIMQDNQSDAARYLSARIVFHSEVIDASRNRFLKTFKDKMAIGMHWQFQKCKDRAAPDEELQSYGHLIDALWNGNTALSELTMRNIITLQG